MAVTSFSTKQQIGTIQEEVVKRYASIPEVQQIYLEVADDSLVYWIFTNEAAYDDALMDRLIEQEIAIMKAFPQTLFGFHYIPLLSCPDPRECISWLSQPIYQRDNGGHH